MPHPSPIPPRFSASLLLCVLLTGACAVSCTKSPPVDPPAQAPPSSQPPTTPPPEIAQPTCSSNRGLCQDDRSVRLCNDGVLAVNATPCPNQTTCLDHGCVPLSAAQNTTSKLLHPAVESGYITAWDVAPLSDWKELEHAPLPLGDNPQPEWTALLATSRNIAWMRLGKRRAKILRSIKEPRGAWLRVRLISDHDQRVNLWTSTNGRLRVYLNGKDVYTVDRDTRAPTFQDETATPLTLPAGTHTLLVRAGQIRSSWHPSFSMRILNETNQHPTGLRILAPEHTDLEPAKLIRTQVTQTPKPTGFAFSIQPTFTGLGLTSLQNAPLSASLHLQDGTQRPLETTTTPNPSASFPSLSTTADDLPDGTHTLIITLNNTTLHTHPFTVHRDDLKRLAVLRSKTFPQNTPPSSQTSWTSLLSRIESLLSSNDPDRAWVEHNLKRAETLLDHTTQHPNQDPYQYAKGLVRRSVLSPLDGKPQPYAVHLPDSYDPNGPPLPVIVTFHGLDSRPEHALQVTTGRSPGAATTRNARHVPPLWQTPAILVAPWGYKNAGQRLLGEYDTMHVLQDVLSVYNADPLRVSLTGYSLGGTVAFTVPLHYPGVFSSAAPLCGYPNLKGFRQIRAVEHTPWEDVLIEQKYIYNYVENGIYLPMYIVHGGKDGPERSEVIVNRYRRFGYRAIFDLQEDLGHNVWDYAYREKRITNWMRWRKRPQSPSRARLKTAHYRYNRAWWLRLIAAEDPTAFSKIFAERDSKTPCAFEITTENTLIFEVDLTSQTVDGQPYRPPNTPCTIRIDSQKLTLPASSKRLILTRAKTSAPWALTDTEPDRKGFKRHNVSGPLDDALLHRQLIVYGTQDPSHTHANRLTAQHLSTVDPHWDIQYPVKADRDVTDQDLSTHTIVLVGHPKSNSVTQRFATHLPVQFTDQGVVFGSKRYTDPDTAVSLIYPHPSNADEYLVLHAGLSPQATLSARHLPRYQPDFLIYTAPSMQTQRGGTLLDTRKTLDGGFFKEDWSVP